MSSPIQIPEGFPDERLSLLPTKLIATFRSHPLAHRLHPTRIGFFPDASGHYIDRPRGLGEYILLLCLKGSGWLEGDGRKQSLVSPGYAWLPAGTPHRYGADHGHPWTLAWLHLSGTEADSFLRHCGEPFVAHSIQQSELARDRFERLYRLCHSRPGPALPLCLHTELANWLAGLALSHESRMTVGDPQREKLDRLLLHLRENLHRPIPMDEMARVTGWTPNYLSTVFREVLNETPAAYFQQLKMTHACERLRQREESIGEIAEAVGFGDPFYFSRCFRRCYGLSPREYRKAS